MTTLHALVVDDSAFMRRAIQKMLEKEIDIRVAGTAASGEEALELIERLKPDVVTMDVEMPGMGGLEAVRAIVARRGPPVIMVSALTREGAETTLRALESGAVDFIPKPDSAMIDIVNVQRELVEKIRHFGSRGAYLRALRETTVLRRAGLDDLLRERAARAEQPPPRPAAKRAAVTCVAIGTSTGGPVALTNVLPKLPAAFPVPIVVVQHMPPGFTRPLAERLNAASAIAVVEGTDGMPLVPGTAVIAPAGKQLRVRRARGVTVALEDDRERSLHVPSVDVMTASVAEAYGAGTLGVILTGMGQDGVRGLQAIKSRGGYVLGQDEASSVVYGMPRAAAAAGLVDRVVPLDGVARALCELTGTALPGSEDSSHS
ncbi:MAG TPA: chemotaxis response regulator protein-glutamate methylesterase [Candidatus Baltobacteraceae bacterium]|nr:chemotaxis response regulator protein-glutamate methylesterase [Candidatus Baltobacteraceae bacterium]